MSLLPPRRCFPWVLLSCLLLTCSTQATETAHGHSAISVNPGLAIADVFAAALQNTPERALQMPLEVRTSGQRDASRQWFAGQPRLTMTYWGDDWLDDTGVTELEAGIEFDLWRWGQKSNAKLMSFRMEDENSAWMQVLQLNVAGEVRESLHALLQASLHVQHAHQALGDAKKLEAVSLQRVSAGDLSQADVLQSQALLLTAERNAVLAEKRLVDAERAYAMLTGLAERPESFVETMPAATTITENHPRLLYLQRQKLTQQARVKDVGHSNASNTTIAFGVRRQRGSYAEPDIDALSLAVTIPIGSSPVSRSATSQAQLAVAETDVQLHQTQRRLRQQLHEVIHELEANEAELMLVENTRAIHEKHWRLSSKAFTLGETDIRSTILALQQYRQTELDWQLLKLQRNALISAYQQTLGDLP